MTEINKPDVYRKAAEVIVRDGQCKQVLTSGGESDENLKDTSLAVCALGACARAHYELYGELPKVPYGLDGERTFNGADSVYRLYDYETDVLDSSLGVQLKIWHVNDRPSTSAEDIALMLKQHAADIEVEAE